MTFVAGQKVVARWVNDTSVTGTLAVVDGTTALDIQFGSASLAFTNADGSLKPRWADAVIEVLEQPKPPEPVQFAAVVIAGHAEIAGRRVFVRTQSRWRTLGSSFSATWAELVAPTIYFEGIPANDLQG